MKGLYETAVVHDLATKALAYWETRFEDRKAKFLANVTGQRYGLFKRLEITPEVAIRCFAGGFMDDLPYREMEGCFWVESSRIEAARNLMELSDRAEPGQMILSQAEIACLWNVTPAATPPEGDAS